MKNWLLIGLALVSTIWYLYSLYKGKNREPYFTLAIILYALFKGEENQLQEIVSFFTMIISIVALYYVFKHTPKE